MHWESPAKGKVRISYSSFSIYWYLNYATVYTIWNENFITSFVVFSNRKSRGIFRRDASQKVHFESLKYSAAKLHEKGIILEIGTLPTNQWVEIYTMISSVIYIQFSIKFTFKYIKRNWTSTNQSFIANIVTMSTM